MGEQEDRLNVFVNEYNEAPTLTERLIVTRKWLRDNETLRYNILDNLSRRVRPSKDDQYPKEWAKVSRRQFDKNIKKYRLMDWCLICKMPEDGTFFIRHHIIPLSRWGTNRPLNIVTLCQKCHAYFHPWLFPKKQEIPVKPLIPEMKLNEWITFKVRIGGNLYANLSIVPYEESDDSPGIVNT